MSKTLGQIVLTTVGALTIAGSVFLAANGIINEYKKDQNKLSEVLSKVGLYLSPTGGLIGGFCLIGGLSDKNYYADFP